MNPEPPSIEREALRQQLLLQALWRRAPDATLSAWLRDDGAAAQRGLLAYRTNGGALAERALLAAFPTLAEMIGAESFAALARAAWHHQPPWDGDLSSYGDGLAAFVEHDAQLASEPCLADVARLDWAVHRALAVADVDRAAEGDRGLHLLGGDRAVSCRLRFRAGTALLHSIWPVVTIWRAHRQQDKLADDRFEPVRTALARGDCEWALVRRDGWRVVVEHLQGEAFIRFTQAVLDGCPLGAALDVAGPDFNFEAWLGQALQQAWLAEVTGPLD